MLYKIIDNALVSTETTEIIFQDGLARRVDKATEELIGWKPLQTVIEGSPSQYEYIEEILTEDDTYVYQTYTIKEKSVEEIVEINQAFWNENYFMIPANETEIYYAPHTTVMNGETYNLLQDDLPIMLMGAMSTQMSQAAIMADPTLTEEQKMQKMAELMSNPGTFSYMDMYNAPDFTQKFTSEYIKSLVSRVTDQTKITNMLGYMATLLYATREEPSVEE